MHSPSYTNLPLSPETNLPRRGPGRPPGSQNKIAKLAREKLDEVFEDIGGKKRMVEWINADAKNLYAFFVYIYPKILTLQPKQSIFQNRPQITKIETVFVDHKVDPLKGETALDVEAIASEPMFVINPENDEVEERDSREELLPGEIPL